MNYTIILIVVCLAIVSAELSMLVIEHAITDTRIPVGPGPDNFGDGLVFANPVFDDRDKYQVATDQGSCIRTVVGEAWECRFSVLFPLGGISVAGPYYDTNNSTIAITGGTGIYQGIYGEMALLQRDGKEYGFYFYYNILN